MFEHHEGEVRASELLYQPLIYSVPHEESKRMLGMCDVTSIDLFRLQAKEFNN